MLSVGKYRNLSPTVENYPRGIRQLVKRVTGLNRRRITRVTDQLTSLGSRDSVAAINSNKLLHQYAGGSLIDISPIRLQFAGWPRSRRAVSKEIRALVDQVAAFSVDLLEQSAEEQVPAGMVDYISGIVGSHLDQAYKDLSGADRSWTAGLKSLLTGSSGSYWVRLFSMMAGDSGVPVTRFTQGGDRGLMKDTRWIRHEFHCADNYIVHSAHESSSVAAQIKELSPPATYKLPRIVGLGSAFHSDLIAASAGSPSLPPGRSKRVTLVTASFMNEMRAQPGIKVHDTVYADWLFRLGRQINDLGHPLNVKRHPKGQLANKPIFGSLAEHEWLGYGIAQTARYTDVYIVDFVSSAFMEALATLKPVVLVLSPVEYLNAEAKIDVSQACAVIQASFDEFNRLCIDTAVLESAIEQECNGDARRQFLQKYLLEQSPEAEEIIRDIQNS